MIEFATLFEIFRTGDAPGLLLYIISSLIFMVLGNIVYRAKMYVMAYRLSEKKKATLLQRWWSGLIFVIRIIWQVAGILKFFLPMAFGIILLALAQLLYLSAPEFVPWSDENNGALGFNLLCWGGLATIFGKVFWSSKLTQLDPSSMNYFMLRKIDVYAVFTLSGISLTFFAISHLQSGQFPFFCALVSMTIAIGSMIAGIIILSTPNKPEPILGNRVTRALRDSGYRFSRIKDPSNKEDTEWWKTEREDVPPAIYNPDAKLSNLEDPFLRKNEESQEEE